MVMRGAKPVVITIKMRVLAIERLKVTSVITQIGSRDDLWMCKINEGILIDVESLGIFSSYVFVAICRFNDGSELVYNK